MFSQTLPLWLDFLSDVQVYGNISSHSWGTFFTQIGFCHIDNSKLCDRLSHSSPASKINTAIFCLPWTQTTHSVFYILSYFICKKNGKKKKLKFWWQNFWNYNLTYKSTPVWTSWNCAKDSRAGWETASSVLAKRGSLRPKNTRWARYSRSRWCSRWDRGAFRLVLAVEMTVFRVGKSENDVWSFTKYFLEIQVTRLTSNSRRNSISSLNQSSTFRRSSVGTKFK